MPRDPSVGRYRFDPRAHREQLMPLLREIAAACRRLPPGPIEQRALHRILRRYPREGRGFFARSELIAAVRVLGQELDLELDHTGLIERLRLRPVRTQSGVTPITVMTRPFPCPGKCVFCPNDVRMPKSYLSDEPGCQRAEANGFDPYLQTFQRLTAMDSIGHVTQKVELIVLGGTWSFYPEAYQRWFVTRCFDAMNDFGAGRDGRVRAEGERFDHGSLVRDAIAGVELEADPPGGEGDEAAESDRASGPSYNRTVERFLHLQLGPSLLADHERGSWEQLVEAQRKNEDGRCRCVGLVVETRPDRLDRNEAVRLRRMGCTKVQIGYQSLDDSVLRKNKRGHDVEATRRAMHLLRSMGFKIHAHWMPNLLGSTPEADVVDFHRIFEDRDFRPDELKVYPCSLIETAELMRYYRDGSWRPYEHDELLRVLMEIMRATPRYCRLSRVIRDICSGDIVVGNRRSNLREVAEQALAASGIERVEIRSREIGQEVVDTSQLKLRTTEYVVSGGIECFVELVDVRDRLAGFCRLLLPTARGADAPVAELVGAAIIRELHVYGAALSLGDRRVGRAQHSGLGSRLLAAAKARAGAAEYPYLAVISAVGTRPYYRRHGFVDGALYQRCDLSRQPANLRQG